MYIFKAWIDDKGGNAEREHAGWCKERPYRPFEIDRHCPHAFLWELNRSRGSLNIIRTIWGSRPFYFSILVGRRYRTLLRLGKRGSL